MPTLSQNDIGDLLRPYLPEYAWPGGAETKERVLLLEKLSLYLDLLLKWNERMSLTSVRDPERIVKRHFGESLFAAWHVNGTGSLLDLGSGAGFPGVPIQLWHPELRVTLVESQQKKAMFLREVARALSLSTEVCAVRAEEMLGVRSFDSVTLRSVDEASEALKLALRLSSGDVWLLGSQSWGMSRSMNGVEAFVLPGEVQTCLYRLQRFGSTWNSIVGKTESSASKSFHVEQP